MQTPPFVEGALVTGAMLATFVLWLEGWIGLGRWAVVQGLAAMRGEVIRLAWPFIYAPCVAAPPDHHIVVTDRRLVR